MFSWIGTACYAALSCDRENACLGKEHWFGPGGRLWLLGLGLTSDKWSWANQFTLLSLSSQSIIWNSLARWFPRILDSLWLCQGAPCADATISASCSGVRPSWLGHSKCICCQWQGRNSRRLHCFTCVGCHLHVGQCQWHIFIHIYSQIPTFLVTGKIVGPIWIFKGISKSIFNRIRLCQCWTWSYFMES